MRNTAIILTAGCGDRLQALTKNPKSLLSINGKSLMEWHINHLKILRFNKIIIVTGYKYKIIENYLESLDYDIPIEFVKNDDYKNKGNAYSMFLGIMKSDIQDNLLVIDADLIYEHKVISDFLNGNKDDSILVGSGSLEDVECAKTLVDKKNFIRKTIDKRLVSDDELQKYEFIGEAIGMIKFTNLSRHNIINECKKFFNNSKNMKLNWEHLMNEYFIKNSVTSSFCNSDYWIEIDTPSDYNEAKKLFNGVKIIYN